MCEHCDETKVWGEAITEEDREEEEYLCEWIDEPDEELLDDEVDEPDEDLDDIDADIHSCGEPATHFVYQLYVEEHVCAEHKAAYERELTEGLAEFLQEVGMDRPEEFLPIATGTEPCDYIDPQAFLQPAAQPAECARPAVYAKRVVEVEALCEEHAKQTGYTPGQ